VTQLDDCAEYGHTVVVVGYEAWPRRN